MEELSRPWRAQHPLHVAFPLGIGDCHWACQKLRALKAYHRNRPIWAYVNSSRWHESVHYLKLVPFIDRALKSEEAPFSLYDEMRPPLYTDPEWSTLAKCRKWNGFDYIAAPNGHLERGERIEDWWPELETDYTYHLNISAEDRAHARRCVPPGSVVLYLSGIGPNIGFHNNRFTPWHWAYIIYELNRAGITPYIIGAPTDSDREYRDAMLAVDRKLKVHDRVGQTTIPEVCAVVQHARVWCGLSSGTGIVSAMQGTPTVMFWSDQRFPIARTLLHTNMKSSWLAPEQLRTYRTFSYGDPEFVPERAVAAIYEVMRPENYDYDRE